MPPVAGARARLTTLWKTLAASTLLNLPLAAACFTLTSTPNACCFIASAVHDWPVPRPYLAALLVGKDEGEGEGKGEGKDWITIPTGDDVSLCAMTCQLCRTGAETRDGNKKKTPTLRC